MFSSEVIERTVEILSSLPTIGKKTAQRLTYYLLKQDDVFIERFSKSLKELKQKVKYCSFCFNYTEVDPCPICTSLKRNNGMLCVVEGPNDVLAIEKTNEYFGKYHILHGVLNPLEGIGPDDIKIKELVSRISEFEEIILALNPSVEGEVTTQYLAKILKPLDVKITRIASGVPLGISLEYSDEATLSRALEGRTLL